MLESWHSLLAERDVTVGNAMGGRVEASSMGSVPKRLSHHLNVFFLHHPTQSIKMDDSKRKGGDRPVMKYYSIMRLRSTTATNSTAETTFLLGSIKVKKVVRTVERSFMAVQNKVLGRFS